MKRQKSKGHCKSMLLPLFASCCLFIHAVCQDIKALKHQIKAKCWPNPNKSREQTATELQFPKPANAFITISLLCNSCITTVNRTRDIKLKIPCCVEYNHSNNIRDYAKIQKWILKPCRWRRGAVYKKDVEGVNVANDTLERLVLP